MLDYIQSVAGEDPLVVEGYFACTPQRMFEVWTDPDIVKVWFGRDAQSLQSAEIDLRPGGKYRFIRSSDPQQTVGFEGEYLEIERDSKLVFSWRHIVEHASGEREETPSSRVEVTFTADGDGTQVYLVHSGISTEDARKGIGGGWNSSFGKIAALTGTT